MSLFPVTNQERPYEQLLHNWGHVAAARKRSHQWYLTLTPNNTKTIERLTCHCFLRPIRRDLTSSSYTTVPLVRLHSLICSHSEEPKYNRPPTPDTNFYYDKIFVVWVTLLNQTEEAVLGFKQAVHFPARENANEWRSGEDLPLLCHLLCCVTLAWLHNNRPKRELTRGLEAWPTCRCSIRKHVNCYNHGLFCLTVQKGFFKRGEIYLPLYLINSFFFSFQFQHFTLRTLVNRFHSTHIYGPSPSSWASPLELKTLGKVTEIHLAEPNIKVGKSWRREIFYFENSVKVR